MTTPTTTFGFTGDPGLLTQDTWDSGALTGATTVVHKVSQPGTLTASLLTGGAAQASLPVQVVTAHLAIGQAGSAQPDSVVHVGNASGSAPLLPTLLGPTVVDVGKMIAQAAAAPAPTPLTVPAEGYIQLVASEAPAQAGPAGAGHALTLAAQPEAGPDNEAWDSRQLSGGDIFAVILTQPGSYQVTNQVDGHVIHLTLDYPLPASAATAPPAPLEVDVSADGMTNDGAHIRVFQSAKFVCNAPARIVVRIITPQVSNPHGAPPPPAAATAPTPATWLPQRSSWTKPA